MLVEKTHLEGVLIVTPKRLADDRGYFSEVWHDKRYNELGIADPFVQDNSSRSHRGVLRGLHFQNPNAQGKLVSVAEGEVFDVAVDIRHGSKSFGKWFGLNLSADNGKQLWIPAGFAHGFYVLSEWATFNYKCTSYYSPQGDRSVRWNDQAINIQWPDGAKHLSQKDSAAPLLNDLPVKDLQFGAVNV